MARAVLLAILCAYETAVTHAFSHNAQARHIARAGAHAHGRTARGCDPPRLSLRGGAGAAVMSSSSAVHPAVEGWPAKYAGTVGGATGPRVLHTGFAVEKASDEALEQLDVRKWPTWSTKDNEKWVVGKTNKDKIMPYGELSYVLSGKLEVIPPSGEPVVIQAGDFVTFPEGFKSTWTCLEELTWHYYLYSGNGAAKA